MKLPMWKQTFNLTRLMLEILAAVFCRTHAKPNERTAPTPARTLSHAGQWREAHARLIKTGSTMELFRAGNDMRVLPFGMFGAEGRKGINRILRRWRAPPCAKKKRKPTWSLASAFGEECAMRARWLPPEWAVISEPCFGIA